MPRCRRAERGAPRGAIHREQNYERPKHGLKPGGPEAPYRVAARDEERCEWHAEPRLRIDSGRSAVSRG